MLELVANPSLQAIPSWQEISMHIDYRGINGYVNNLEISQEASQNNIIVAAVHWQ